MQLEQKNALFIPEIAFELLVKRQIRRLVDPSIQCAELVYDELQRIVNQICDNESKEFTRFNILREKILDVVGDLLAMSKSNTISMINDVLGIELAYINTAHPDFIGTKGAINNITETIVDEKVKERETQIIAEHEAKKALQNQTKEKLQGKDKEVNTNYTAISKETQNLSNLDWTGYLTNKDSRGKKRKKEK